MRYKLTFDVEAAKLWGQGFAVGYVVNDENGVEVESGYAGANPMYYIELGLIDPWVVKNVLPFLPPHTHETARDVRDWFWPILRRWVEAGAIVQADCGVPVEANFINDCVMDEEEARAFQAPYPLHEIGTVLMLAGIDPRGTYDRQPDELPTHHPTNDSRQSARLEREASQKICAAMVLQSYSRVASLARGGLEAIKELAETQQAVLVVEDVLREGLSS